VNVWLLEGTAEPGFQAWNLEHIGFATWAPARDRVLERVPGKFDEHREWLFSHGFASPAAIAEVNVVEELHGDELLFARDRDRASVGEIDTAIALLGAARADLLTLVGSAAPDALTWDPPYRHFAPWADWRTVAATLAHLANGETHYYTAMIGHASRRRPAEADDDWREYLPATRAEAAAFLLTLKVSLDRVRLIEPWGDSGRDDTRRAEAWSVRKALRRMVRHELLHTRSIRRILQEWEGLGETNRWAIRS
jgi:hypothetical protein